MSTSVEVPMTPEEAIAGPVKFFARKLQTVVL
jgi:hypothetical protein